MNEMNIPATGPVNEVIHRVIGSIERMPGQTAIVYIGGRAYKVKVEMFDTNEVLIVAAPSHQR